MKTNSWKSSGPFVDPKVKPRGRYDPDATKTLLDAFDEGDGMIPINHFLDAALAQVAE